MTWSLDPFLCPLVNEIEDLFINGTIQYSPFITSHMRGIFRVAPRNFFRGKTKNLCGAWWITTHGKGFFHAKKLPRVAVTAIAMRG